MDFFVSGERKFYPESAMQLQIDYYYDRNFSPSRTPSNHLQDSMIMGSHSMWVHPLNSQLQAFGFQVTI